MLLLLYITINVIWVDITFYFSNSLMTTDLDNMKSYERNFTFSQRLNLIMGNHLLDKHALNITFLVTLCVKMNGYEKVLKFWDWPTYQNLNKANIRMLFGIPSCFGQEFFSIFLSIYLQIINYYIWHYLIIYIIITVPYCI